MKNVNVIAENNSAQTAQTSINETANTKANENAKGKGKGKDGNEKPKRKPVDPVWRILGKARKGFDAQWLKTNEVKLESVTRYLPAEAKDVDKFWSDFFDQLITLLRDRMYTAECDRLNCNPIVLGEHIVYLGSATVNKVLKLGIYTAIGGDVELYTERFSPADADKYIRRVANRVGLEEKLINEAIDKATEAVVKSVTEEGE